jgi:hypothetical protein
MKSISSSYDPMTQKFVKERGDLYSVNMDKAGSKLRQQNYKNKKRPYEVQRDPLDGNVYLHVDPAELANMSPEEI